MKWWQEFVSGAVSLIPLLTVIAAVMGGLYKIVQVIAKRFPPRAQGLAVEVAGLRADVAALRSELMIATDYMHDLREDFATATGRAPRDWPEGLRQ